MFSQKKSFFKEKMFLLLIAGLLVGGYWINKGGEDTPKEETQPGTELSAKREAAPSRQADNPKPADPWPGKLSVVDSEDKTGGFNKTDSEDNADGSNRTDIENNTENHYGKDRDSSGASQSEDYGESGSHISSDITSANRETLPEKPYYLVRNDGGMIKIYYCEEGKPDQFIRATEINYSLLRESDQKMFEKGIVRKTKDGLSELLQDFES